MRTGFWTPVKVGLLTVIVAAILIVGIGQVTGTGLREQDSYTVYAIFDDATGLRRRSRVQIAGIEVGQIEEVQLVGHKARVSFRIRDDVVLYTNARISKRSEGLIGDMSLDIFPGSERFPVLPPGGEIREVVSAGSIEQVFETLGTITADIQGVTAALREVVGEDTTQAIQSIVSDLSQLTDTVNTTILQSAERINSILALFEGLTAEIHDVTVGERRTITSILHNIERLTVQVQEVIATIQGVIGTGEDELREGVADLRQTLDRFNRALDDIGVITGQVSEVTTKVAQGEGTLGRLVADDGLIRDIEGTVADASDFVDRLMRLQTEVSLRSELHTMRRTARTTFQVRLIPGEDKYYAIGVVDPVLPTTEIVELVEINDDGVPVTTRSRTTRHAWQLNAYMARRWAFPGWSVTGRFGLFEGTGGLGGDLGLAGDQLRLSLEAFEFMHADKPYPRIRAFATWSFLNHLFLTGGVDDAFNARTQPADGLPDQMTRDFFIGGGFFFTDDDLKAILTTVGVPVGR
jgi:phospholipid/cholesterol/gamma-HCH transport system substrate-binding protein